MNSSLAQASPSPLRSLRFALLALVLLAGCLGASPAPQRDGAPLEQLNVPESGLALEGYDPVAYFPEGGGKAVEGSKEHTVTLRKVTYRFGSEKTRELFLADPEKYEPAYGGWCAFAMVEGDKVEVDPESFLIEGGHLLVFYDGLFADTRKSWLKAGEGKLEPKATKHWNELLGREPMARKPNPEPKLGLEGKDPLTVGEGQSGQLGLETITTKIGGVKYRFLNRENRVKFLADPESYLSKSKGGAPAREAR